GDEQDIVKGNAFHNYFFIRHRYDFSFPKIKIYYFNYSRALWECQEKCGIFFLLLILKVNFTVVFILRINFRIISSLFSLKVLTLIQKKDII
ncbi:MAG: hypothetical protein SO147_07825, partial [Clostridia bacterium]|nr:hypothetical protein [Clostridia bacterium]